MVTSKLDSSHTIAPSPLVVWDLEHVKPHSAWMGLDEVGRGCLAGPVVAGAVMLSHDLLMKHESLFSKIKDSKKLTPSRRTELADELMLVIPHWTTSEVDVITIDRENILRASLKAMKECVTHLPSTAAKIFIDGNQSPQTGLQEHLVVKGDDTSCAIAAASIIAKVSRDRKMLHLHETYPQYGFDQHKGYGTPQHLKALDQWGACPQHRISFRPVALRIKENPVQIDELMTTLHKVSSKEELGRWFNENLKNAYGSLNEGTLEKMRTLYVQRLVAIEGAQDPHEETHG